MSGCAPRRPMSTCRRRSARWTRAVTRRSFRTATSAASERKLATGTHTIFAQRSSLLEPIPSMRTSDVQPMPADQFVQVAIPLYYEGHVYRAGNRIRVTIAAPNGAQPVWAFSSERCLAARRTCRSPVADACRRAWCCRSFPASRPPAGSRRARACATSHAGRTCRRPTSSRPADGVRPTPSAPAETRPTDPRPATDAPIPVLRSRRTPETCCRRLHRARAAPRR